MRVPRRTFLACVFALSACAACGADGEYTAARMPGSNVLWTAGRTAEEIGKHTNNGTIHLTEEQTAKIAVAITSAPPQSVTSVNGQTGAVVITAAGLGALTAELDPVALAALSANRVTRWYDPADSNKWAEWVGMTNIVVYEAAVSGTNFTVTLSDNFAETVAYTRPAWTNNVWPLSEYPWIFGEYEGVPTILNETAPSRWEGSPGYPSVLTAAYQAQGTATVSIASYVYGTNETHRYYLPTNAIPPELTNLDLLQAWLNNIYATTNALAAVSGALGTHTNDAPAHVSASDRAAWYGVTNLPSAGCTALDVTDATNLVVTGSTYSYTADVTNAYWLSIAESAPAYHYSLTVYGTNACTLADNMRLIGTKTVTGTNCVSFKPFTNGLWEVLWGGK